MLIAEFCNSFRNFPWFGNQTEDIIYGSKIMRQYLLNYLRYKRMEPFQVQDDNPIQYCKRKK